MTLLVAGGVYWLPDEDITLLPPEERALHPRRPVITVSSQELMTDADWPFALVIPTSTQPRRATRFCIEIKAGEGNLPQDTWARVPAVQPVMKSALTQYIGLVPPLRLTEIKASVVAYMGLLD